MSRIPSRFRKIRDQAMALLDDRGSPQQVPQSKLHKFVHFWVLVWKSFVRNRLPVRASALAYVTLLALVPLLAVVMSITSSLLKTEGEDKIEKFIESFVASITPAAMLTTNLVSNTTNLTLLITNSPTTPDAMGPVSDTLGNNVGATQTNVIQIQQTGGTTNKAVLPTFMQADDALQARKRIAHEIHNFIQNTRSGAIGFTGTVLLVFAAISLLARIEDAFNDIWGEARRRTWFMRVVLYWSLITLAPILLIAALGLASGPHFRSTEQVIVTMPFVGRLFFLVLPIFLICLTFASIYILVPNTRVNWRAAAIGGLVGGVAFHLNNVASVLYVSRVVSNSRIYGTLALVPVFMIGLYVSWVILLFGAQVAYAFQNRSSYLEERQVESINQRGREFLALRLMTFIAQNFARGETAPGTTVLAQELSVPGRLIREIMGTLMAARLVVESAGPEGGFIPARPLEQINCHDILLALRASQGQELATRDEPVRHEVYGEFARIQEAERNAAVSVTLLSLVHRAEAQLQRHAKELQSGA